jgi:hypothetical protein
MKMEARNGGRGVRPKITKHLKSSIIYKNTDTSVYKSRYKSRRNFSQQKAARFTELGAAFSWEASLLTNSYRAMAGEGRWAWPWQKSAPDPLPAPEIF